MSRHAPPRPRLALLDSDLLASRSVRACLGLIAENGSVVMGATGRILQDAENAVRDIVGRRREEDPERRRADAAVRGLNMWIEHYRQADLWFDWSHEHWASHLKSADIDLVLHEEWISRRTDPEDEHVAAATIMCELDALCTGNRNMIGRQDWLELMAVLDLSNPPRLCRRERIIDFLSGETEAWLHPDWTIDKVLSVMRPSPNLRTPIRNWATRIRSAFPKLSRVLVNHIENVSEPDLQERYRTVQEYNRFPITRKYVAADQRTPPAKGHSRR